MLDFVKQYVLSITPPGCCAETVDKYWNEFAAFALLAPLLWFHYTRLLATTYWNHYNVLVKLLLIVHLMAVICVHELIRILVYKLVTKQITPTDIIQKSVEIFNYAKTTFMKRQAQIEATIEAAAECIGKNINEAKNSFEKSLSPKSIKNGEPKPASN